MDNYPMMSASELAIAPWMQEEPPEKSFEVTCSQSLSKTVDVITNSYNHIVEHESHNRIYDEYDDTSDVNWAEEYHSNDYHTPIQLIEILGKVLKDAQLQGRYYLSESYTKALIKECEGWIEDETEYIEN